MQEPRFRLIAGLQVLAAFAFCGAWAWLALRGFGSAPTHPLDLATFATPFGGLSLLTMAVAVGVVARSLLALRDPVGPGIGAARVKLMISAALAMGAVWPFLLPHSLPGTLLAVGVQVLLALRALDAAHLAMPCARLSTLTQGELRDRMLRSAPVALFAGWSIAVAGATVAVVGHEAFAIPSSVALGLGLIVIAFLALAAQLSARLTPELSLAVIWALIGTAANQIGTDLPATMIATAAVSLLAVGIVRITS